MIFLHHGSARRGLSLEPESALDQVDERQRPQPDAEIADREREGGPVIGLSDKRSDHHRADALEATADNLEDQAKAVRESGDQQADAIDDADVNAQAMPAGEKAALVNGSEKLR